MKTLNNYIYEKYLIDINTNNCQDYDDLLLKYDLKEQDLTNWDDYHHINKVIKCSKDLYKQYIKSIKTIKRNLKITNNEMYVPEIEDIISKNIGVTKVCYTKYIPYDEDTLYSEFEIYSIYSKNAILKIWFDDNKPLIKIYFEYNKTIIEDILNEAAKIIDYILNYENIN